MGWGLGWVRVKGWVAPEREMVRGRGRGRGAGG
jgi:hypothetical protein